MVGTVMSRLYDMGYTRSGCIFCLFGLHLENRPNRLDILRINHPKIYKFCMEKLNYKTVLEWYPVR